MKKLMAGVVMAAMTATTGAWAQDSVRMQLKWVTQAQFAGYYVAEAKGFYAEENLAVEILPGGPDIAPEQVIAGGGADVITTWMPAALAARERGVPLVNIAQPFSAQGLSFVCRKDMGVETVADFPGKTLGVWFFGNEYPFYAWMAALGLTTEGGADGVEVLKQAFDVEALLNGQAACISVMTYNEYGQVLDAGLKPEELTFFSYANQGVRVMEDGLYVLESSLADPGFADKMVRFVRATMKGWKYAEINPEEAAAIVVEADQTGLQTLEHQTYMMGEVAKLTAGSNGALDPADFDATVAALLAAVSPDNPAITAVPAGMAWTHAISDLALN
jgi:NitT/TauT family transport system substrate-binding protein